MIRRDARFDALLRSHARILLPASRQSKQIHNSPAAESNLRVTSGMTSGYGPRKRSPLKWIMWQGSSAIQTSDSHAICAKNDCIARRVSIAVTNTRPALQPANSCLSSILRLPSTGPALVTASTSRMQRGALACQWACRCFSTILSIASCGRSSTGNSVPMACRVFRSGYASARRSVALTWVWPLNLRKY